MLDAKGKRRHRFNVCLPSLVTSNVPYAKVFEFAASADLATKIAKQREAITYYDRPTEQHALIASVRRRALEAEATRLGVVRARDLGVQELRQAIAVQLEQSMP